LAVNVTLLAFAAERRAAVCRVAAAAAINRRISYPPRPQQQTRRTLLQPLM